MGNGYTERNNKPKQKAARTRVEGPSVVMRVPAGIVDEVHAFVDIMADYRNRPPYGETRVLPPSRTDDAARRRFCTLMGALADYEKERQARARRDEEDRRQLYLFDTGGTQDEPRTEGRLCHLVNLNEHFYAHIDSLEATGFTFWHRIRPAIRPGDTAWLVVQAAGGALFLVKTLVEASGECPPDCRRFVVRKAVSLGETYRLRFLASCRDGGVTRETLQARGLSRHSVHKIIDEGQDAWLDSLAGNADPARIRE